MNDFKDDFHDRTQRVLNEHKRQELTEKFLVAFFNNDERRLGVAMDSEQLLDLNGRSVTPAQMVHYLKDFHASQGVISHVTVEAHESEVRGDYATVELAVSWDRVIRDPDDVSTIFSRAKLRLKRSLYTGWNVIQVKLPTERQ